MRRKHHARAALVCLAATLLPACGDDGENTRLEAVVRDSAGMTIVENPDPATIAAWTLGAPAFSLGSMDGGEANELYEPFFALRLPGGGVVLANQGTEEIRFYDDGGAHVRTIGRSGGGPGEFQALWGLYRLPGDSLGAWDWTAKRLTLYDTAGVLGRMVTPRTELHFAPRVIGALDDGTVLLIRGMNPAAIFGSGGGRIQDSVVLPRFDLATGEMVDSLGPFPGAERFAHTSEGGFWIRNLMFGRDEHFGVGGGLVVVGDDRDGAVRYHAPDGRLDRVARLAPGDRAVTEAHVERYRARQLEDVEEAEVAEQRRRLDQLPVSDRLPAFAEMFVDRTGRVWLREFDGRYEDPSRWLVLDRDGRLEARLDLPYGARPLDAGPDYLILYARDDLDVERVTLYPLVTGARP